MQGYKALAELECRSVGRLEITKPAPVDTMCEVHMWLSGVNEQTWTNQLSFLLYKMRIVDYILYYCYLSQNC